MAKHLLFATSNIYKLQEVRSIIGEEYVIDGLDSIAFSDEIPETGDTIEENAIQKVNYIADYTDLAVFAEDTGLIVPALGGAPGVHSARYAGDQKSDQDNIAKLMQELEEHGKDRRAYFQTVLAYRDPAGEVHTFTGEVQGRIIDVPRGTRGFGYDPVFVPDGYEQTFAELGEDIKNRISHRRQALDRFRGYLG